MGAFWILGEPNVPKRQGKNGNYKHQPGWHEFFCFRKAYRENHQQYGEEDVGDIILKDNPCGAKTECNRERHRHDKGHLALRLKKTNHPADNQQDNVYPENFIWAHL